MDLNTNLEEKRLSEKLRKLGWEIIASFIVSTTMENPKSIKEKIFLPKGVINPIFVRAAYIIIDEKQPGLGALIVFFYKVKLGKPIKNTDSRMKAYQLKDRKIIIFAQGENQADGIMLAGKEVYVLCKKITKGEE